MPERVRANILAAYALTGCDTTNALFRITKAKAVTTLEGGSTIWRPLEIPKIRYPKLVKKECKRYIAGLYGDFEELTEAQYKIYASKVTKNE